MTDQTEYYRWRKSVSSSYYEDEPTGLEVWLEGRKPLLAEIERNRAAIGELVAALKELLVVSVEPAGLTREIATDLDAFNHFMGIVESRVTAAVDSARAAIAKHDTPTKGETP